MADGGAEHYPHGHHDSVLRSHGWRTAENSAAYLLPHLRPGLTLLDVGTGPGTVTVDLARRLAGGRVVGLDSAPDAVAATRRLAEGAGVDVQVEVGDARALRFPDAAFDVVHAHQVLQHLAEPVSALAEMRRVCRADGLVAARDADYGAMTWYPPSAGLDRWRELYRALARGSGGEPDAGRRLHSWAAAAGYSDVTSSASVWCFSSPADLAWWTGTWAERVTASTFAARAVDLELSDAEELAALARAWRAWGRQPGAWFAVLHAEVLARPPSRPPSG